MMMTTDLAGRSPDIHRPDGFDPATAGIFAHNELLINASCEQSSASHNRPLVNFSSCQEQRRKL
jgi:hypothetical protein